MHFLKFCRFPRIEHGSFITGLTSCLRLKLGSLALARTGGMDLLTQAVQIAFGNGERSTSFFIGHILPKTQKIPASRAYIL